MYTYIYIHIYTHTYKLRCICNIIYYMHMTIYGASVKVSASTRTLPKNAPEKG